MPPFDEDVFISYRHVDNESLAGNDGWVDVFHRRLRIRLGELLGREARIWRDPQLQVGEKFGDEIIERLASTKMLVCALSPGYIKSEWCLRELREFCRLAGENKGLSVGNKMRAVKVVKTYIPRDSHPEELRAQLGAEFFEEDETTRKRVEFSRDPAGPHHQRYLEKIEDLAVYMAEVIDIIDRKKPAPPPPPFEKTIYLAQTTTDLSVERERVMRELRDRGFHVLPDAEPNVGQSYSEAVVENLRRSRLSIHLVGRSSGVEAENAWPKFADEEERKALLEGRPKSFVEVQNDLAAERAAADPKFVRLVWIPEGLEPADLWQEEFVRRLLNDAASQRGAEVTRKPFEAAKTRIIQILEPPKPLLPDPESLKRVYLMCDKLDFESIVSVRSYLRGRGYEVIPSARDGEQSQVSKYHKEVLKECDATLIFFGSTTESWIRLKLLDLKKAAGWRKKKPLRCRAVYVAGPENEEKRFFDTFEAVVLRAGGDATLDNLLDPFVNCLETHNEAGGGGQ